MKKHEKIQIQKRKKEGTKALKYMDKEGKEDTKEKVHRFGEEIEFIRTRWIDLLKKGDPYYNPNFSLKKCNYALKP